MAVNRIGGLMSGLDTDSLVKQMMAAERIPVDKMIQNRQKLSWKSDLYRTWNKDLYSFRTDTLFNMKLSKTYGTYSVNTGNANAATGVASASAIEGTHTLKINQIAEAATLKGKVTVASSDPLSASESEITVKVKDAKGVERTATVKLEEGDNIGNLVSKLNLAREGSQSLGIQAYYDRTLQQFVMKTKDTGEQTEITLSGDSEVLQKLGIAGDPDATEVTGKGKDADLVFNGESVKSSSNTVTMLGVTYTLKDKTMEDLKITVNRDIEAEINNIKEFVNKYNEVLGKLNTALSEKQYRSFHPLTDAQKEEMTEKQIEQWEAKAKSGLLRSDSDLSRLVNSMRLNMTAAVDNGSKYNTLASIGIGSTSYLDQGVLTVNEDKLRQALMEDPDAVRNLFTQDAEGASSAQRGVIARIYDDVGAAVKKLTEKAGAVGNLEADESIIGKMISDMNDRITRSEQRLVDKENSYYRKFTAMEKALSNYNAQAGWLAQQFGGGQ